MALLGPASEDVEIGRTVELLGGRRTLRHAGPGASIKVRCTRVGGAPALLVIDNGPGVPADERGRLFDRFHRLEESRSTPGSGLGLALVAAVARLHGAAASLHDAAPGLEARVVFPAPA